jgi:hypothetical protein
MTDTRQAVTHIWESRQFKSMCTLQGKTLYTRHVRFSCQSTYTTRTLPVDSPRTWQPFMKSSTELNGSTAPEKKKLLTQSSTRRLTDPYVRHLVSLPQQSFKHMLATSYISLLGPYHQHMISMFNTCSRVPTPRFLTDPSEDYKLRGAVFPHYTPRPSQPTVLCFSLVVVLSLRLPNININL